ncbi:uncharacterized protein LOC117315106 [Pecten maximus]|uniref:uncharacterized protein LOC117315106 n=1 Tax=Pecten maximus TaxID=6579 RepID=UPI0014581128|nr:uncharacterized protein LOC117315106 [Pecten maximus]
MPARRGGKAKAQSKAPPRRGQKTLSPPPRDESAESNAPGVLEVTPEEVPTPDEESPELQPAQGALATEKKPRGAFKLKTQDNEVLVIEWVQENRLLWDQKDHDFKNKSKKDRLWSEKAEELGYEVQFLKTWYTDLRDFNTKLLRVQSGDGARTFTDREQWVMGQFQFLKERIRHRRHPLHSVQSSAAAKDAIESGNLEEAERLATERRRSLKDIDQDSTSSNSSRSSKRQRGSQEEADDQYLEVLRKELVESQTRLTALQQREPDDERTAYMKYVSKVVCKSTEDAFDDFQTVFMDWQARWKVKRQHQQRSQPHTAQHHWYPGSSESAQWQPQPHQWRQPTPQMQATSVWGSQSMDFMPNSYSSAAAGGPSQSGSTSLVPHTLQHLARPASTTTTLTDMTAPISTNCSSPLVAALDSMYMIRTPSSTRSSQEDLTISGLSNIERGDRDTSNIRLDP